MKGQLDTPHGVVSDAGAGILIQVLRNIANGYWNAGRDADAQMTVEEYAKESLVALRLWNE